MKQEYNKKNIIQFLKFGIVGVSNTVISLAVYYLVIYINKDLYLMGSIAGWIISVGNAFFWNERYVFKQKNGNFKITLKRLGKTYLCYGITFLLSTIMLYLEVDVWNWSEMISPLFNLLITIPLNFFMNKFWTFK